MLNQCFSFKGGKNFTKFRPEKKMILSSYTKGFSMGKNGSNSPEFKEKKKFPNDHQIFRQECRRFSGFFFFFFFFSTFLSSL